MYTCAIVLVSNLVRSPLELSVSLFAHLPVAPDKRWTFLKIRICYEKIHKRMWSIENRQSKWVESLPVVKYIQKENITSTLNFAWPDTDPSLEKRHHSRTQQNRWNNFQFWVDVVSFETQTVAEQQSNNNSVGLCYQKRLKYTHMYRPSTRTCLKYAIGVPTRRMSWEKSWLPEQQARSSRRVPGVRRGWRTSLPASSRVDQS